MFLFLLLVIAVACSEDGNVKKPDQRSDLEALLNKEMGYLFSNPEAFLSLMTEFLLLLDEDSNGDDVVEIKNHFREKLKKRWEATRDPVVGVAIGAIELMDASETSAKGLPYIREAADQGLAEAYLLLGMAYATGEFGIEEDKDKASALFKSAAEAGSSLGMVFYGQFLESADEKEPDYRAALEWYRKAAEAGFPDGMVSLGQMYLYGRGVIKDYKEFVRLTENAVVAGDYSAAHTLALAYHYGNVIPEDKVKAYKWYNIASSMFSTDLFGEYRDELEKSMTAAEIEEAQELSREFLTLPAVREKEEAKKTLKRLLNAIKAK